LIILIVLAFGLIAVLQIPFLVRNKQKKELIFYTIFLFIGFSMAMLYALGVKLPNPVTGIKDMLDMINVHY